MMKAKDADAKLIAGKIISYLKEKGKLNLISEIAKDLLSEAGSSKVQVYFAVELSKAQKDKVISKFGALTHSVDFDFIKDVSLIDGIVVKHKDKTWDLSLKNNLEKIKYL